MAKSLIQTVKDNLAKENLTVRTKKARDWLRRNVRNLQVNQGKMLTAPDSMFTRRILTGKMYFYSYNPKLKDELPFYDRFPLVIPIERYNDGFLGLNLHYISTKHRLILLDKLYALLNNKNFDETTRMRISYDILNNARKYKEFEPCVKRYLYSHLNSKVIEIKSDDWEIAIFLPTEKFVGASSTKVQRLSVRQF
jgi:hypothetical protein